MGIQDKDTGGYPFCPECGAEWRDCLCQIEGVIGHADTVMGWKRKAETWDLVRPQIHSLIATMQCSKWEYPDVNVRDLVRDLATILAEEE